MSQITNEIQNSNLKEGDKLHKIKSKEIKDSQHLNTARVVSLSYFKPHTLTWIVTSSIKHQIN